MQIRLLNSTDAHQLRELYRLATAATEGLIREPDEITLQYIEKILALPAKGGIALGLVDAEAGDLVGAIHAYPWPGIRAVRHLLTDLTIAVHPRHQGKGYGRTLFQHFLGMVELERPDILRVELYTYATNFRNRSFYESLGFEEEGAHRDKILDRSGQLCTPISMVWFNPAFNPKAGERPQFS
jgi:ribosomal protein S18 acetylase RimI-like enzyme